MPDRLDVFPGRTLVLPLDDTWTSRAATMRASFDSGLTTEARLFIIQVRMTTPTAANMNPGERTRDWLPTPGLWSAVPASASGADERGARVLVVKMPDEPVGRSLRVGGRTFELNWLPTRDELEESVDTVRLDLWRPAEGAAGAVSPSLASLAWPDSQSPITRWRYRLLMDGLRPTREDSKDVMDEVTPGDSGGPRNPASRQSAFRRFDDRVIETIARQNEERWRVGLARLWLDSPDLAPRVKRRLATVCDFGNGVVAPAWPTDHNALDRLLADLVDPRLTSDALRDRVGGWLSDQARGVAWVADDSGTIDVVSKGGTAMIDVANLDEESVVARVDAENAASPTTGPMSTIPARGVRRIAFAPRTGVANVDGSTTLRVRVGESPTLLNAIANAIPLTPPGLQMGPFSADLDMESWLRGGPRDPRSAPMPATAAVLSRTGAMPSGAGDSGVGDVEVFVECRGAVSDTTASRDVVRLWIGPSGAPISVLRVDATGAVSDDARRADLVRTPGDVRVLRSSAGDRWSFRITLPPRCVEPDGTLRLAITRIDPAGRRSTWPRAMLPWQEEPGRVRIDTKAWDR